MKSCKKIWFGTHLLQTLIITLSGEIAHPKVYHHLSQLYVNIQVSRLSKFREYSGIQLELNQIFLLTQVIFSSLDWNVS